MAEEQDEDLVLTPADAGAAFRFEMAATNFFLGYWKHLLAGLIVFLLTVLAYGQYKNWIQKSQRAAAARIADVQKELPPIGLLSYQKATGSLTTDPQDLKNAAEQLLAVADASSGTAAVEARLKAAELYRITDDVDGRRKALEAALGGAEGVLRYSALSALAALDLEAGNGDASVARYRELMGAGDDFLAQQAAIELGLALEHLGRNDEASKVYADFLAKWPDAARAGEVRDHSSRVGGTAG